MTKKIYFAGSIRGGRTDADLYQRMIAHIKRKNTVLTEHVGDLSLSMFESTDDLSNVERIYQQDTTWLRQCDMVIAECTTPSLGVGYEMAFAEKLGKPCHILYNKVRCRLSAMLSGNNYFHLHPYMKEEEVYRILDEILT